MEKYLNYKLLKPLTFPGEPKKATIGWFVDEYKLLNGLTYGVFIYSIIDRGRIKGIDNSKATKIRGVLTVLSYLNRPSVPEWIEEARALTSTPARDLPGFRIFYNDEIRFYHQPVALVIAESFEAAVAASKLVKISYIKDDYKSCLETHKAGAVKSPAGENYTRGVTGNFQLRDISIKTEYSTSLYVNDPMELHAATVLWDRWNEITDNKKILAVKAVKKNIAASFRLKEENVKVHISFPGNTGESFSKLFPQEVAAILGAQKTGRPIAVMANRHQIFSMLGYQASSIESVTLEAAMNGALHRITHDIIANVPFKENVPRVTEATKSLYACDNLQVTNKVAQLNTAAPCRINLLTDHDGSFALESALDELSGMLNIDPVLIRLKNFAEKDPENGLPWSSNYLKECYHLGAEKFGWSSRNPRPGSMYSGDCLLGMGMSAGICKADHSSGCTGATFGTDGILIIQGYFGEQDATSIYMLSRVAAAAFDIDPSLVQFITADLSSKETHNEINHQVLHRISVEIYEAVKALQQKIIALAISVGSLQWDNENEVIIEGGILKNKKRATSLPVTELLRQHNLPGATATLSPTDNRWPENFSTKSFCAHFVEVLVHPATGRIKVNRVVTAVDAGKMINLKEAAGQVYNSIMKGLEVSLAPDLFTDHKPGFKSSNTQSCLPLYNDVPPVEIIFVDKPDNISNKGFKGLGEIGLAGFSAALANAVYHATGKRLRFLPLRLES